MTGSIQSCVYCGVVFAGIRQPRYCSRRCRNRAFGERHREERRASMRQWHQRQSRPRRPAVEARAYGQCGEVFTPGNTLGRYCSVPVANERISIGVAE